MYNGLTRNQVRIFFCDSWSKYLTSSGSMTPIEEVAVDWIILHPEYHSLIEDRNKALEQDYTPERGETNPFLHLSMHLTISEQVAADSPQGIKDAYHALIKGSTSEHEASHEIMECLAEVIWMSQRTNKPLDLDAYSRSIRKIVNKALSC